MEEEEIAAWAVPCPEPDRDKQGGVGDSGSYSAALHDTELHKTGSNQRAAHGDNTGSGTLGSGIRVLKCNMQRNGSSSCVTRKSRFGSRERDWLKEDPQRGCVFLHGSGDPQPPSSSGPISSSTSQSDLLLVLCTTHTTVAELCAQGDSDGLYLQQHGDLIRRLDPSERPLQIVYDYLAAMGFEDPLRIQSEAANSDLSCMMRFYSEKPCSADQLERILLKGVFSVRKGKTQLHKWAERQVILCGTCLIVASVKDSLTGKMHILPLVGGKVEEVKRRQHCLMFSSAGPQAQTYFVNFDSLSDYQRWHRQASKVVSQTVSVVDLSCYSLEEVPECLFYSQDVTHLNLRNNFMRSDRTGGLHSLSRFSQIKSLNLSHNRLGSFPESLCEILTLTELNLSCNGIRSLPTQIENLHSLQTLSLDGNHLSLLPEELGSLSHLSSLGLSFNNFSEIPAVLEMLSAVDRLAMAGNCLERLDLGTLSRMSHFKHIDLRLNGLQEVVSGGVEALKHITHMDLRDNRLSALDLSAACNLEQLHCQRNSLGALTLSGFALRALHTSANHLMTVNIYPVPNQLTHLDLSRNLLEYLPDWVCDTRKIEVLDVSHNLLTELPGRLLSSLSLRKLLAGHNHLHSLPNLLDHIPLEALDLQHNKLGELPESLFYKALNLRYLNVSANSLETVPPSSQSEESLSALQELYLTSNNLNEQCAALLAGHQNLRVLHIAYNQLQSFPPSKLTKLELLEELNLSGNKLKTIPSTVANCKRLHTLIAHSNHINVFPEILNLPEIKLVDLSFNELTEILLPDSLPPTLQELDLSGNTNLILEHKTLNIISHIATLKLDQKPVMSAGESMGSSTLWNHGYSEMTGQRNKLCVSVLAVDSFGDNVEAAYGIFDGDRNEEVPRLLQCTMGDVLSEEIQHSSIDTVYMSNTFLSSHRKLGMAGQKLGASALLCYIQHDPGDPGSYFSLTLANVGTCQAVLCRDGQPLPLSRVFSLEQSAEETERVKLSKAIITEDNKVSGVTCCSRLLGCSYLSPWVLPKPWVRTEPLCAQDEFLILGNRALFEWVSYQEAVCTVQAVRDPRAAAKKLCTLAQSYGCRDNVGAVVVSLHIGEDSCTCELPLATAAGGGGGRICPTAVPLGDPATPSTSSGIASEFNSEMSASEVGSEAGSIASDENPAAGLASRPERRCSLHPTVCAIGGFGGGGNNLGLFQRQPSCATFSSNQSDNGLDSDDEAPLDGVISNGSKLEVEVDIHCCAFRLKGGAPEGNGGQDTVEERRGFALRLSDDIGSCVTAGFGCRMRRQNSVVVAANGCLHSVSSKEASDLKKSPSTSSLFAKKLSNGSVVTVEESHNLIEVALEAPKKKRGYFAAPAQQDPEDQLVVPPGLERDVQEQLRYPNPNPDLSPPQPAPTTGDLDWDHTHLNSQQHQLQQPWDDSALALQQEVYDTAL
ncbi:PH domain leucine-rich repeat-containing protein phosphatase 2-like isoform X2 [Polyodon spathula]|uniref:PH domain leucine-rich repeat-containing protein phosphatase 2-like isoform X2 n=1 Tax=Polyodon spathula TaxID=7913 RepID=UPI001B7F71AA|nr:PH domain leucine-rich repeat-containing protein phosphatase 2-like isoform X2 [Polyodon spathula]